MDTESLDALEMWFSGDEIPARLEFQTGVVIVDPNLLVSASLRVLRAQLGNKGYLPYYNRLLALKTQIEAIRWTRVR